MPLRYQYVTRRYKDRLNQQIDKSQKPLEQQYRQLLNDVLHQSQQAILHSSTTWRPLADILESTEMMVVKVELAGMREDEIEVTLYEDALVISGERHDDHEGQSNFYHEAQIRYGPFRLEVYLPYPIQREQVTARYENGILWIDLPKLVKNNTEALSHRNLKRPDASKEVSLPVQTYLSIEENERAFVGSEYSLQASIPKQPLDDFSHPTRQMNFDVLLLPSENITLTTTWHKQLPYHPGNLEPQLIEFTFRIIASGPSSLSLDFYHERRWLRTIRFDFLALEQPQTPIVSSEVEHATRTNTEPPIN